MRSKVLWLASYFGDLSTATRLVSQNFYDDYPSENYYALHEAQSQHSEQVEARRQRKA